MMMGETSVCVGNSISGCFIYSNRKYNGRRDNPECIKRKYLRRFNISANKFSNRPRISCWSLVGVLIFSLVVYLPSIVQAQNSTIAPLSSPFISSNISYPPSYTPSSPPISSQIESLGVDDNQPILGQVVPVPAVVTVPSTSAPTEAVAVPSTPPPTEVSLTVGDDGNETSPTQNPTEHPSATMRPSGIPSDLPTPLPSISVAPTVMHSESPTVQATMSEISEKKTKFRQNFVVGNEQEFSVAEVGIFESIYIANTPSFAPEGEAVRVTTNCTIFRQQIVIDEDVEVTAGRRMQRKTNATLLIDQESGNINSNSSQQQQLRRRHLQEDDNTTLYSGVVLKVDYIMQFDSKYYSVENYTRIFQNWTNLNLETIKLQMNLLNINVTNIGKASRIVVSTPSPTISPFPSVMPTGGPTITAAPSTPPTEGSSTPSLFPSSAPTDNSNTITEDQTNNAKIIWISVTIAIAIIAFGLLSYCIKRRQIREIQLEADAMKNSRHDRRSRGSDELTEGGRGGTGTAVAAVASKEGYDNAGESSETKAYGSPFAKHSDAPSGLDGVVVSPNGSLVSNQSLLSRGNSMGEDSKDEADTTQIFADEFDQYKDQNLEKMRADIEENLEGCDGMMSQAVARALIDEDDVTDVPGVLWGGNQNVTGPEIEASALGIIMDWLKRNDKASAREKREMMQETLNKMTASVRYGILGPNDASRTIHECAGLLGLQLAAEIPVTTILISGMRKKATENDIRQAFSVFGDVVTAAVASNERGFGILRFTSDDAVDRAMKKFKTEEVVVEDVAVQLRVIKPGSHN
mmetsp:Transcript_16262/g.18229  ORF Transcript_16262/g.18229 Transcript_16262/m.18229 type:complete len:803 (+) Transcript_16262:168-2576(+)